MAQPMLIVPLWISRCACAPRLSVRAAAEIIVARATSIKLSNSSASMRAVLKTFDLSFRWMRRVRAANAFIFAAPCASSSAVRNTPACACIVVRISSATHCAYSPEVDASSIASRVKTVDRRVTVAWFADDLTVNIGRDAAHLVMDGRYNRNRFPDAIHVCEFERDFSNRWQPFVDRFSADMR